tara:strand:+ start:799 stop:1062 length:264 start_codon:yes stop_codon:yes gene_type:complete
MHERISSRVCLSSVLVLVLLLLLLLLLVFASSLTRSFGTRGRGARAWDGAHRAMRSNARKKVKRKRSALSLSLVSLFGETFKKSLNS